MVNFTSNTYILKRKILTFTKKFSRKLSKPERKFTADITYKEIKPKDDVIRVARTYFSRWKIEEYFRCKKQMFQFENFRVRKLKAINALNFYITLCMAFLAMTSMESETNALKVSLIKAANPVKEKVFSAITGWRKVSAAYCHMQKKSSGFGFGQNVRHTVNSALS